MSVIAKRMKRENRFLPTLSQVQEAAQSLPDPESYHDDTYETGADDWNNRYSITFKRVRFASRQGKRTYRWIYDGKIMVRHRDSGNGV